jgi:hypothetical protein
MTCSVLVFVFRAQVKLHLEQLPGDMAAGAIEAWFHMEGEAGMFLRSFGALACGYALAAPCGYLRHSACNLLYNNLNLGSLNSLKEYKMTNVLHPFSSLKPPKLFLNRLYGEAFLQLLVIKRRFTDLSLSYLADVCPHIEHFRACIRLVARF